MRIEEIKIDELYYIYGDRGNFVCSADTRKEAEADVQNFITAQAPVPKEYVIQFFRAKSRWITKNGQRLQVATEEFSHFVKKVTAASEKDAIRNVKQPGYIYTNIQIA